MTEFARFALLGLGAGAIYGLLAQGIVLIYRGSAALNLAQGAFAMVGAFSFQELRERANLPGVFALVGAVMITTLLGLVSYLVIFRPLRSSSELARLIAALGLLLAVQAAAALRYGTVGRIIQPMLPSDTWELLPNTFVGKDRLLVFLIGVVVTAVLWAVYRYTSFGRVTVAVAENPRSAAAMGYSPVRVAASNWALGAALAGLGGALIAPITGLQVAQLSGLVVPALAAALASGFLSFPISFLAGVLMGVAESEVSHYVHTPGWSRAVPFLAIVALLVIKGRSLPGRGELLRRLPVVSPGDGSRTATIGLTLALVVVMNVVSPSWGQPLLVTAMLSIVGLSVVVVTGFAGQLSLVTFGMAGVGALVAGRAAQDHGAPFLLSLVIGGAAAGLVGLIVGLPALRTRGPNLAIITLGLGAVMDSVLFSNPKFSGGVDGINVGDRSIFGWDINSTKHLERYATVVAVVLGLLVLAVQNVRRGATGRKMLAVRANERAAASVGINITTAKLYAFGLSSVLAGVGGVLLTFRTGRVVLTDQFGIFLSIAIVGLVVMGSVGFPGGALIGASLAGGAIVTRIVRSQIAFDRYVPLVGGLGVLITVLLNPDGILADVSAKRRRRQRDRHAQSLSALDAQLANGSTTPRRASTSLVVEHMSVRYGGVVAVSDVSLTVEPGAVLGLIGPNGAGKTTFIDAVTGFAKCTGSVRLGPDEVGGMSASRRARRGISRSFQSLELFEDLTVLENLCANVGADSPRRFEWLSDLFWPSPPLLSADAKAAITEFGLEDCLLSYPRDLSFGRRRLIGIARAVSTSPTVLLLDEPGAGLDTAEVDELGRLILGLARERGIAVLLVEHHIDMVMSICDDIVVLDRGQVLAHGAPSEIAASESVIAAYIGTPTVGSGHSGPSTSVNVGLADGVAVSL